MALAAGDRLGQYRIVEQLGRGAMGTVFKAYQPALSRHVAIKVLPAFLAEDPTYVERFRREAVTIASMRHPNIVTIHDSGEEQGVTYLVMELVAGGTLAQRLGEPLALDECVAILGPIASALDYAHAHGVIHRDVKPSNILLQPDGTPVLSDFGTAFMLSGNARLTGSGRVVGTPAYMAPEQAAGEELSPPTDIYALATVLYEMLTGSVPFTGDSAMAVLMAQISREPPSPLERNPDLPPSVVAIVARGLAKAPEDRYASAGEMIRALEVAAQRWKAAGGRTAAAAGRQAAAEKADGAPRRSGETLAVTARRSVPVLVGVAALVVVVAGSWALAHSGRQASWSRTPIQVGGGLSVASETTTSTSQGGSAASRAGAATPGIVLYNDDFSKPDAGRLPILSDAYQSKGYADGEYFVRATDPGLASPVSAAATLPSKSPSASLAIGARLVSESPAARVILACHYPGDGRDSGYRLEIQPSSAAFSVQRRDNGTVVELAGARDVGAVHRGGLVNQLEFTCARQAITAVANGARLASLQDDRYANQVDWWIGVSSGPRTVAEARFSSLTLTAR